MPKVSVIVPIYRAKQFLVPCVSSLKRQGLSDLEILLVDDCSPDDTYEYALEHFGSDENVRVIRQAENGGPGRARNRGIEEAKGEYICFCDVDDVYIDGAVSYMLQETERLGADVYSSSELYITVADPLPDDLSTLKEENLIKTGYITNEQALHEGSCELAGSIEERTKLWLEHHYHWNVFGKLYRTDFLRRERIRFSDVKLGEDHLFILNVFLKAGVYASQVKALYIYRTGNVNTISRGSRSEALFLNAMKSVFSLSDVIDETVAGIPFFDEHPEYVWRLKYMHIRELEEGYAVAKYHAVGREVLSRNREVTDLFTEYFGKKGAYVEKILYDAYDGRAAGPSIEEVTTYENMKKIKDSLQTGFFSMFS